jgi:hypothetical protein
MDHLRLTEEVGGRLFYTAVRSAVHSGLPLECAGSLPYVLVPWHVSRIADAWLLSTGRQREDTPVLPGLQH